MKKYIIIAAALSFAVLYGCGNRNSNKQGESVAVESHDGHDHGAEGHNHEAEGHDGHDHAEKSCDGHDHEAEGHDHEAEGHEGHNHEAEGAASASKEGTDEIVFPATQAARTTFEVKEVQKGPFRETLRCGGDINASQSDVSVVTAPIAGVVTFVDGRVIANSTVTAGQGLFRLSSSGLASGDAVLKAQIAFRQAEADFNRTKALYKDKLVTQRDYLAAESEYLRAKAEYDPVRGGDSKGTLVKAPSAGYVLQLSVAPGDYVEMGQPLATIAKSGHMQLRALVSQRYFNRIHGITDANFRVESAGGEYYTISKMKGRLNAAGKAVAGGSAMIPVVFDFESDGRFPNGAYAEIVLLGNKRDNVVSIPRSAITEQQGLYYVYVQLDPDCYRRQEVKLGAEDGINVEILRGLAGGEKVVTKGAVNVKMAAASGAIPHGHSH